MARKIDALLLRARTLRGNILRSLFPGNSDGFLEALGVDPALFVVALPDGTVGYDFIGALCSTAADDWAGWEVEEE